MVLVVEAAVARVAEVVRVAVRREKVLPLRKTANHMNRTSPKTMMHPRWGGNDGAEDNRLFLRNVGGRSDKVLSPHFLPRR